MKKIIIAVLCMLLTAGALAGCGEKNKSEKNADLSIVATIFPGYDWVREIMGDEAENADITMLMDNGTDLHSYQPTADDISKISKCDLFIYAGGESDEWVKDALKQAENKDMKVINMMEMLGDSVKTEEVVEGMESEHGILTLPGIIFLRSDITILEQAEKLSKEKGYVMKDDSGRGYRRVVASPLPQRIVEIEAVKQLWDHSIVITCGGGGIPVIENPDGTLRGVAAVIDKDFAAELLAEKVDADILMILTEVEKVAIDFGKPDQKDLSGMTLAEAAKYVREGQFPAGSMLPKVEAAMKFVRTYPDKKAIITSLDKAVEALEGKTGTVITFN